MAGKGGARPGAGRPRRMDEQEIIEKLTPLAPLFFEALESKLRDKEKTGMELFAKYYLGEPLKRVQTTVEGNLTGLTVEIINRLTDESEDTSK
jgi:hypothetical protein